MSSKPLLGLSERESEPDKLVYSVRQRLYRFFNSKIFHSSILLLVSLDVACLFAVGLVFSCLFVLELLIAIWVFDTEYFKSKFHIFDAAIILVSFFFEVALQGVTEEVASLIIILRLIRVVKIIDEFSVGAEEQMKALEDRLADTKHKNEKLQEEVNRLKAKLGSGVGGV
ncbi:hypothetical protein CC78DRAFT_582774 [Lojkania enalia]|uniref:Voltage-gated hydrogen channel 1 n=1 Tax=Lojkania enalia TaxID=147567 RepID=A0A9P4N4R4_9PLEO|nr:hypothetical protein CC78DRAFT_582774 [Didymosphaeria enalia]